MMACKLSRFKQPWGRLAIRAAVMGTAFFAVPGMSSWAQEPPPPEAAPRNPVSAGEAVRKGAPPPAKDVVLPPADAAAQPDADAKADHADSVASTADRGRVRAEVLKKLEGGPVLMLEADPNNPPSFVEPLRLEEAVAFALKNNYEVLSSHAKLNASQWDNLGGYAQYLPHIDYDHETGQERSRPASYSIKDAAGNTQTAASDTHHTRTRSLTIRQPLIDPAIIADILQRNDTLGAVEFEDLGVREKTALATVSSFLRLSQSRLLIGFAEHYKAGLDQLAQRMRDRVSGGGASGVELDRITARSVSARSAIIEAHSEYQAAIVEFRRLTGVNPIKLALPDSLMPSVPDTAEDVLTRSLRNNPDYNATMKRADAAIGDMEKSFAGLLPKFAVQVSDTRSWNAGGAALTDTATCTPTGSTNCVWPYANDRRIMGVLTWSLNGGSDITSGFGNRARAQAASYTANDTRTKLEESVRVGFDALNSAGGRIDAVSQAVEANAKVTTVFEEQYLAGSRQLLDLLDSYERLYNSQIELARLLIAESSAGFQIRRLMGELVPAILSTEAPETPSTEQKN